MRIEAFDAARSAIAERGLTSAVQTKIALFVCAAKNANAFFLGRSQLLPLDPGARQFLEHQCFRECEAALALARTVQWDPEPALYARGAALTLPLWGEAWRAVGLYGAPLDARSFYSGAALGQALLSEVRLVPVLPADADPLAPLVMLIHRIEQDNARALQTQLALLKTAGGELPMEERERIVESLGEVARRAFSGFLDWIIEGGGVHASA
ncbi:MAG: hypothetical protein ACREVG_09950 [Burkholderiales bacterium]